MHKEWEEFETHEIVSIEQVEGDVVRLVSPKKESIRCPKHDKKLKLYCDTCGELICQHCTVQIHKEHKYCVISDTFETHKEEILSSLEPVKKQLGDITEAVARLDARREEIAGQRENVKVEIHSSFQQLRKTIDESEAQLSRETDQIIDQKLENIDNQKSTIETMQAQRSSCLHFITESIRTGSQGEVMKSKKQLVKQVKDLTERFDPDTLILREQANVNYRPPSLFTQLASGEMGDVYEQHISPDHCFAEREGTMVARVGKKATATLQVCDDRNEPCSIPSQLECQLVTSSTGKTTECSLTQQDRGPYEIAYQPTTRGPHELQIKVNGRSIRGSPFAVTVKRSIDKLGTPIKTINGLNGPWGVAVNKKEEVLIAEADGKCVSIFSPSGKKIKTIDGKGSANGPLGDLRGVAVDSGGNILVLDRENKQVRKFSPDGESLQVVGSRGDGPLQFQSPFGVAVNNTNGNVYVVDYATHCVQVLNSDLSFVSKFGSKGSGEGQFNHPYDIALDSAGSVYVTDTCNNCIQIFEHDGRYLRQFGKEGSGPGELNVPVSICIDSDNVVYIGEGGNSRISLFTSDGKFLKSFGSKGSGLGQFDRPYGIAVDKYGLVYVSDHSNKRVQLF